MSIEDPQQLGVNSRRSYIFSSDIVDRAYENLKTAGDLLTVSAKKKKKSADKLVEISLSK